MPTLEITTMIGCPLMCRFCPQSALKTSYDKHEKYLSLDDYVRVIDKIPRHLRVDFSGMAEPWANPHCTRMLRYAFEAGFTVGIYTTLYGMTGRDAEEVIELLEKHAAQLDVLCLHLPDADGNMRGWRPSPEWEAVFLKFRRFGERMRSGRFEMMTMNKEGRVHEALWHLNINLHKWDGLSRAGSLSAGDADGKCTVPHSPENKGPISCNATPFYDHNVLLPNGDVLLCCMDYNRRHVIGNLIVDNYYEIFSGKVMAEIHRENMRSEFSAHSICRSCEWAATYRIGFDSRWVRSSPTILLRLGGRIKAYKKRLLDLI